MKRKILNILLVMSLLFTNQLSVNTYSSTLTKEQAKERIEESLSIIQLAINNSYKETEKELRQEIIDNDLDYFITTEYFYQLSNPYKSVDITKLLAAYMTAKNECSTLETSSMYDIPFIQFEMECKESDDTDEPIKYGVSNLSAVDSAYILEYYGLDSKNADIQKKYNTICDYIQNKMETKEVYSQIYKFIYTPYAISDDVKKTIESLEDNKEISYERKRLVDTATSLVGRVPYQWGGKPHQAGYDTSWWSLNSEGEQKGLDCSGYLQWCFITAGYPRSVYNHIYSSDEILRSLGEIQKEDLQPGDIGIMINPGGVNHVGMYIGNEYWIHCSSGKGTVAIEKTEMFKHYAKAPEKIEWEETMQNQPIQQEVVEEDEVPEEDKILEARKNKADSLKANDINENIEVSTPTPSNKLESKKETTTEIPKMTSTPTVKPTFTPVPTVKPTVEPVEAPVVDANKIKIEEKDTANTSIITPNPTPVIEIEPTEESMIENKELTPNILDIDPVVQEEEIMEYQETTNISEKDVKLLAQLIYNEANIEGMNGWIAVAEVVKNRIDSPLYPNTVYDVIYQKGQFSDNYKIKDRVPTEEQLFVAREVLAGNLVLFGNKNVLYFRNAKGSTSNWGKFPYYTTVNHHQFYTQY